MRDLDKVARAICKSRSCEGISCCQWPANMGRTNCPVKNGGYDDAARAALSALGGWDEAIEAADNAIEQERAAIMGDGYDYNSGREAGMARAQSLIRALRRTTQKGG